MRFGRLLVAGCGLLIVVGVVAMASRTDRPRTARAVQAVPGPVESAIAFLSGLTVDRLLDASKRERWLTDRVAARELPEMRRLYADEARAVAAAMTARPRLSRSAFLGYRLTKSEATRAEVSLWTVSLGGAGTSPVALGWRTFRVRLVRDRQSWKVTAVQGTPGPAPTGTALELREATAGFRSLDASP
jgi:hypothetical protein